MDKTAGTNLVSEVKEYQSSIAQHLSVNVDCVRCYSDECFTVLSRGRSRFHLAVLEAVYIHTQQPVLCKQKQYIAPLQLYRSSLTPNT